MPLKVYNRFTCDNKKCERMEGKPTDFYYNPNPNPQDPWDDATKIRLSTITIVQHPLTGSQKFACCEACHLAIIAAGDYVPPVSEMFKGPGQGGPGLTMSATDGDVKAAAAGARATSQMKNPGLKPVPAKR